MVIFFVIVLYVILCDIHTHTMTTRTFYCFLRSSDCYCRVVCHSVCYIWKKAQKKDKNQKDNSYFLVFLVLLNNFLTKNNSEPIRFSSFN